VNHTKLWQAHSLRQAISLVRREICARNPAAAFVNQPADFEALSKLSSAPWPDWLLEFMVAVTPDITVECGRVTFLRLADLLNWNLECAPHADLRGAAGGAGNYSLVGIACESGRGETWAVDLKYGGIVRLSAYVRWKGSHSTVIDSASGYLPSLQAWVNYLLQDNLEPGDIQLGSEVSLRRFLLAGDSGAASAGYGAVVAVSELPAWLPAQYRVEIAKQSDSEETAFVVPLGHEIQVVSYSAQGIDYDGIMESSNGLVAAAFTVAGKGSTGSVRLMVRHPAVSQFRWSQAWTGIDDGLLAAAEVNGGFVKIELPGLEVCPQLPQFAPDAGYLSELLGIDIPEVGRFVPRGGRPGQRSLLFAVLESERILEELVFDAQELRGIPWSGPLVVTAPGKSCDIICRVFSAETGKSEQVFDVASLCGLVPYWSVRRHCETFCVEQRTSVGTTHIRCRLSHRPAVEVEVYIQELPVSGSR
jgi:predicted PhzF superfamily epimerase YddE/YHI9